MVRSLFTLVLLGLWTATTAPAQVVRPIRVTTPDNVVILGDYYTVPQTNAPAVIFLHGLKQKRVTWSLMAEALQKQGIAVVTIDLRGHGESLRRITAYGAQLLDVSKFNAQDYQSMMMDIEATYGWLEKQPEIDRTRIGLVGTSLSANLAIRYAAINDQLAALVLLSPSLNNAAGLRTDESMKKVGNIPMRIVVSRHDSFFFNSANRLLAIHQDAGFPVKDELVVCTGPLHGTDMLVGVKTLPDIILKFLESALKQPRAPAVLPSPAAPAPAPGLSAPPAP